ncbi:hypothetical protein [Streptosporangium sp. NPDC006007]|uniref:hypothetical protein n=1 Tax=Streptosporangium sp. NPDC006007 TaxID=3154575 RepID=UPI0033B7B37F
MPRDLRSAALGYLRSGAVTVLTALSPETGPRRPYLIKADVIGHKSTYQVGHVIGHGWACTCRRGEPGSCAHVAAVALVVGHDTSARPTTTKGTVR